MAAGVAPEGGGNAEGLVNDAGGERRRWRARGEHLAPVQADHVLAVAMGEGGVKTVEDLADLATDEIRGGNEVKNGERTKVPGVLESFNLAQEEAEMLILQARVAAGWIDASELPQPPEPEYEEELAEGEYDADAVFAAAPEGDESEVDVAADEDADAEVLAEDPEQTPDA